MATATKTKKPRGPRANSKSEAIRVYMKRKPSAGPTAICAALKKNGLVVSSAHVSNVKATLKRNEAKNSGSHAASSNGASSNGATRRKPGRPGRKPAAMDSVSLSLLLEARNFAADVGGVEQAVELLHSLAKLQ